jgi:hypothetical protein
MSVYKEIRTEFRNRESLLAAFKELGIPVETSPGNTIGLYGYHNDLRPEKASVVVRRQHVGSASNDLGFAWDAENNVFKAIISEYDTHAGGRDIVNRLKQPYAKQEINRQAKARGYMVHEIKDASGAIRLTLRAR